MGTEKSLFDDVSSLRRMGYIFLLAGQVCQLFAFASGLVGSSAGVGAMHVIAGMAYGCVTMLLLCYWCIPELRANISILYAVVGLSFVAAVFILIGMCVHAANNVGTPYYSTMLICFSAFLSLGGAICIILDFCGYQLKTPPEPEPQPATGTVVVGQV